MIKTTAIPDNNSYLLPIPRQYIGKKIEILFYALEEVGEVKAEQKGNAARFKGLLTTEEADLFDEHLKEARKEWERDI
jgi:hypothetical protein